MRMACKTLLLLVGISIAGWRISAAEPENLLPPVTAINSPGDHWEQARNAEANAIISVDSSEKDGALKIEIISDSGYAFWRNWKVLAPGTYTCSVICKGRTNQKNGPGWEIYSFDKTGEARRIGCCNAPSGAVPATALTGSFVVPDDSVKVRIGLGFSGRGVAWFSAPALYKGKIDLKPTATPSVAKMEPPPTNWTAEWLWLKEHKEAPRAFFRKEFTLEEEPVCAMVQLTADNGYALLVNGQPAGGDMDWRTVEKIDITVLLKKGPNRIELEVVNFDGPAGCILQGHIWNRTGKMTTLKTDGSWTVEIPGVIKSTPPDVLGTPPVNPWRMIPCQQLLPVKSIVAELIRVNPELNQGETFVLVFKCNGKIPADEIKDLNFYFYDASGNRRSLSAFAPIVRYEAAVKQLSVELPVSRFAAPGRYSWKLEGITFNLVPENRQATVTIAALPEFQRPPAAHFPKSPANIMNSAGGKQALFTYLTVTPEVQSFFNWSHTGGHMYEVHLRAGYRTPDGKCDLSQLEKELLQILEADPKASVYLQLRVDVPGWWGFKNPDEIFLSNRNRSALQSFCSDVWRRETVAFVNGVVNELRSRPVGAAIAGVLPMAFRGGEFQLWGEDVGEYDCSPVAKKAFAAWQKDNKISPEISLPHPALAWPFQAGPDYDRIRQNYFRFVAERNADNIIYFAREFKKTFGDQYSFGVYFGYPMEYAGSLKRMLYAGHLGVAKVLNEAPLDVISCPASYGLRRLHQSHAYMYPVDSALLHGIMPIIENDIRNYVTPYFSDSSGTVVRTLNESLATNRKLNLLAAAHGTAVRYLALLQGDDFFAPLPIIRGIAQDNELVMKLKPAPLGMKDQVAMIIDPLSWTGAATMEFNDGMTRNIGGLRDLLMRTGRSVVFITADDWEKNSNRWQAAVIPLPGLLSEARRDALVKVFGPLPAMKPTDEVLVLRQGKSLITSDDKIVWQELALPEAAKSGLKNIWYVGGNFTAVWDGAQLDLRIEESLAARCSVIWRCWKEMIPSLRCR